MSRCVSMSAHTRPQRPTAHARFFRKLPHSYASTFFLLVLSTLWYFKITKVSD